MRVSQKQLPKSQIQIDVSVEAEEYAKHREPALALLAKELNLEGFRPGHVPVTVAEKQISETTLLAEMARMAIAEAYQEILAEQKLDAIGEPEVHVVKLAPGNPLEFQITIAILPEIQLPEYKTIASQSEKRKVTVEEKEIEDALQWLKESRKTKDGVTPEIDDDFAKTVGNFESVTTLKESVTEGLLHEKELKEKERVRQEIVEHIAEQSKAEIPEVLVEREKQVLLQNLKQGVAQMLGISFEEYLAQSKKTEQELLDSFLQEAEIRVKRFLVLREVAKQEGVNPTQEEVEQEAHNILSHYKQTAKANAPAGGEIDPARLQEYTEGVIRHEKTLQFLEQLAKTEFNQTSA